MEAGDDMVQILQLKRCLEFCKGVIREPADRAGGFSQALARAVTTELDALDFVEDIPQVRRNEFIERRTQIASYASQAGSPVATRLAVGVIVEILEAAVNQMIPAQATRFPKIADADFRTLLERDLLEAEQSARERNWKSCIVMCGSILEAALYEFLLRNPTWTMDGNLRRRIPTRGGTVKDIRSTNIQDQWSLKELIDFAHENGLLKHYAASTLHDTLREPRNLIHPMKEIRRAQYVSEETASVSLCVVRAALAELAQRPDPQ
jgi:hypothetical protein